MPDLDHDEYSWPSTEVIQAAVTARRVKYGGSPHPMQELTHEELLYVAKAIQRHPDMNPQVLEEAKQRVVLAAQVNAITTHQRDQILTLLHGTPAQ